MTHLVIKEAKLRDLEEFLKLYAEFYNELRSRQGWRAHSLDEYCEDVKEILAKDKVFLAEEGNNALVGFIRVSEREGSYWIEELYVKPEYRGRGIGRRLVEAAEKYVSKRDLSIYTMVLPQDRRAMSFWLHMGYTLLNTIELAKDFKPLRRSANTRPLPLLSDVVEISRWTNEEYTQLEKQFLELVEEFRRRGGTGESLLKIFVNALRIHLNKWKSN